MRVPAGVPSGFRSALRCAAGQRQGQPCGLRNAPVPRPCLALGAQLPLPPQSIAQSVPPVESAFPGCLHCCYQ
eukprot:COSAG02_NODE_6362_length_3624_cov_1.650213_4_plen_73_part_00